VPSNTIQYDVLAREALRHVVRDVLELARKEGLPGEHHFFITFDTRFPGVKLSKRMLERYPEEMTIVIQHSFWNLHAGESAFEIDLSFDDIRERLRIPYEAVKGFFDPAVKFGLQFDAVIAGESLQGDADEETGETAGETPQKGDAAEGEPAKVTAKGNAQDKDDGAQIVSLDSFRKKK